MNINENILLVVVGNYNPYTKKPSGDLKTLQSEVEKVIDQLVFLWKKNEYTCIHLEQEVKNNVPMNRTRSLIAKAIKIEERELLFDNALQNNNFSRIVLVGNADRAILDFITQFAQTNHLIPYRVTDAIIDQNSETQPYFWFKNITSHQIVTLFKSIKDQ